MQYHKINGVPLDECTAEQKIAYNLAFMYYDNVIKEYNRLPMQFQKSELVSASVRKMLDLYRMGRDYKPGKYNEDAIFCALNAGFENYLKAKYHILSSYKAIGEMFPANYLNKTN